MSLKKKVVIGGAIAVVAMGLVFGGIKAFEYYGAKQLVVAYEDKTFPNIKVNEKDVSELSKGKLTTVLKKEVEGFETRTIEIKIGDQQFTKTLADFNLVLNHDINKLADEIFTLGKDLDILEQAKRIEQAPAVEYTIDYSYDEELLDEWIQTITDEVYVEKEEPTFQMVSYGQFEVNEGQVGYSIDSKILKTQIQKALNDISDEPISISVEVDVDKQSLDPELLKSVNTKISTYSSTFPVGIPRAKNVELATSKVDKALLMPGDEFSFTDKVSPVISSSGYVNATVFLNSKPVDGIGGGICQISTTLYHLFLIKVKV